MSPRLQSPLSLEYILLGLLNQNPSHGYDLYKQVSQLEGVALVWHIKQSSLYALLEKLEEEGLVTANMAVGDSHPPRKEYHLTASGMQRFDAWRNSPVNHVRDMRQEFLAKLWFALKAGRQDGLDLLTEQEKLCQQWLENQRGGWAELDQDSTFERMVFQFRIHQTEALLRWLQGCREELMG